MLYNTDHLKMNSSVKDKCSVQIDVPNTDLDEREERNAWCVMLLTQPYFVEITEKQSLAQSRCKNVRQRHTAWPYKRFVRGCKHDSRSHILMYKVNWKDRTILGWKANCAMRACESHDAKQLFSPSSWADMHFAVQHLHHAQPWLAHYAPSDAHKSASISALAQRPQRAGRVNSWARATRTRQRNTYQKRPRYCMQSIYPGFKSVKL